MKSRPTSNPIPLRPFPPWLLHGLCLAVLVVILCLGLWPFHSPRNSVSWLTDRDGLRFGPTGVAFTTTPLPTLHADGETSGTIEIWLQPQRVWDSGTFLAIYAPGRPGQLLFRQSLSDLELQTDSTRYYLANAFRKKQPALLTVTMGPAGTRIFLDGKPAAGLRTPGIGAKDLSGRLILGSPAVQPDTWSGQIFGLAIYARELSPSRIQDHFKTWTGSAKPEIADEDQPRALYRFDERSGRVAHDRSGAGNHLFLPERYEVIDKVLLEPFWKEFSFSRSYWSSVVKNVIGFLPFGFCFYPCLLYHRFRRPVLATVAAGFLVSVTIEILQAFLPTRDSGMSDIFTNSLGTWLGVLLFRESKRIGLFENQTVYSGKH